MSAATWSTETSNAWPATAASASRSRSAAGRGSTRRRIDSAYRLGQGEWRRRRERRPESAFLLERAQHLAEEEGVEAGHVGEAIDERRRHVAPGLVHGERRHRGAVEPTECDTLAASHGLDQRARESWPVPVAIRDQEKQMRAVDLVRDELEQSQRRLVGPVQVLERDEQRRGARDAQQVDGRLEQPITRLEIVAGRDGRAPRSAGRQQLRYEAAEDRRVFPASARAASSPRAATYARSTLIHGQ